ncbi:MAG: monovalent cation/H+ antiporter complex subunit F [Halodesulfurarchaeum sp.]
MTGAPPFLDWAIYAGLVLASVVTLLASYRVVRGPTVPDRVVALDALSTNVVVIAVLFALWTGQGFYVMVGLVLAIIGFISTITAARYVTEGDIVKP